MFLTDLRVNYIHCKSPVLTDTRLQPTSFPEHLSRALSARVTGDMELERVYIRGQEETSITDLPTKILNEIVSHLPQNSYLIQIALVSKLFKDLVEPFLYRSISLTLSCSWNTAKGLTTDHRDRCFVRLVENLTRYPYLRQFVVTFRLLVVHHSFLKTFNDHDQLITLLPSLKELTVNPPPPHLSLPTFKRLEILNFDFSDYSRQ